MCEDLCQTKVSSSVREKQAGCFLPSEENVISPEILAEVFEHNHVPFSKNTDGSVDNHVYMEWLASVHADASKAFEEYFDIQI